MLPAPRSSQLTDQEEGFYTQRDVLERAQVKALPVVNRAAELAPATQACCGVCRTCATTNVLTLAGAAGVWALSHLRRVWQRT
jgi:hypothetical protein